MTVPDPMQGLIDGLLEAVWLVDAGSLRIRAANAAAGDLFGVEAASLCGRGATDLCATPEDLVFWSEASAGLVDQIVSDTLVRDFSGRLLPVTRRVSRIGDGLFLVTCRDRSAQRAAEEELETRLAELRATLESTADGILVTDLSGHIRSFNHRFAGLWALPEEVLARRDDAAVRDWMRASVVDGADYERRLAAIQEATMLQTSDVFTLHSGRVLERLTLPQCTRGHPIGRVFSFRDITEKLAASARIEELSHTDALTGLPNRRLLADRIEFALAMAQRGGNPFALMVLNIDRFKQINDTLGLGVGDRVLLEVTDRIKASLRNVDTVARLGGDEFVLLVHQADAVAAEATARRVIDAMARPFTLDTVSFTVTCSIGIAQSPADGDTADDLMRRADAAMHRVKEAGRASFRFHQPRGDAGRRADNSPMQIDHAMRQALASGQFRLHYQPQIDLKSGQVIGAEALIRWRDPVLGEVSPAEFIPVAEESGFIIAIGDWVLAQAVRQAAAWRANGLEMPVSINVSALQFQQPDFIDHVADALKGASLPARLLELELTESILIHDAAGALQRLQALEQLGVQMAIDDFGTGYSSLGYLKRFPIARLKIDRSFIKNLPDDTSDVAIVNAIIQLGRALNLRVIAEGVETEAQRQFLHDAGCDEFQGFLFAPALDHGSFEGRVGRGEPMPRSVRLVHPV
ncbi:bifunctional diguanylate cyclase/phosphodiesterase [Rhizobacter sp. OV335]|uniref:putative bifunctional diguanylate cyclase/phosphodiesterase n=1 Tax=Rhizobacter sp. OV335 TaxID=1500264 RepID=UPI0009162DA0|nr:bifunctional diguanylate cyclase/phosphodiesterase [Rhizobacter sp. OV335]SHN32436.1 diguanylate cyclase (GGDEF) domain-containing protein [Rhizobacter sp. OV335]